LNFIIVVNSLPTYTKRDINMGQTPPLVYQIIEACRGAFFFSHGIRKEVTFAVVSVLENLLIVYEGEHLRYLGPEERGQALLLEKVVTFGRALPLGEWKESTPGMSVWHGDWATKLADLCREPVIFFNDCYYVLNQEEILTAQSCILSIGTEIPESWLPLEPSEGRLLHSFPAPFNAANVGTKLLYLHHERDLA